MIVRLLCPPAADGEHHHDHQDWWRSGVNLTGCRLDFCAILLKTEEGAPNIAKVVAE